MTIEKRLRSFIIFIYLYYFSQGILYEKGSVNSQIALLLIFLISGYYLLKSLIEKNNKNKFYFAWTLLLFLNIIGFIFTGSFNDSIHYSMFKGILIVSLTFYPFYYFSSKGYLTRKNLIRFFLVMLPISIFQYYINKNAILSERISTNNNIVNNVSYLFVGLIPYTLLFKKKLKTYLLFSILIFFIIVSAKRGAILIGAVCFFILALSEFKSNNKKNIFDYLFLLIGIAGLSYFIYNFINNNEYVVYRFQLLIEGNSSGRDIIYSSIIDAWLNSKNLINLIFGYGFASSIEFSNTGNLAHNDWLEILINFGFIGLLIYSYLFYTAYRFYRNLNLDSGKKLMLLLILAIWILSSLFSMFYTSYSTFLHSIILGYIFGDKNTVQKNNHL